MKFRPHLGCFAESMAQTVEIEDHIYSLRHYLGLNLEDEISFVECCYDIRNDWDTYMVKVNRFPVGFTDFMPSV